MGGMTAALAVIASLILRWCGVAEWSEVLSRLCWGI